MAELPRVSNRVAVILALHFVAFFLIPYLPRSVLILTDALVVRLALLAGLIASAYVSPLTAVASLVLVAFLFMERNKVKMHHLERAMQQSDPESPAIADIVSPETAPEQPPFEEPRETSVPFMPQADSGDDSFAPVAESMNEKKPLPTEGSNDGSQKAIDQLFRWVNPVPAQTP